MTGVGPHGKKTIHVQPPSDDEATLMLTSEQHLQMRSLHDILQAEATCCQLRESPPWQCEDGDLPTQESCASGGKENVVPSSLTVPPVTPAVKRGPKPSSFSSSLSESVEKAKERIAKIPKKCSFEDTLMDLQQYVYLLSVLSSLCLHFNRANLDAINAYADQEGIVQERQMLLKEYEAGIWSVEEYQEKVHELSAHLLKHSCSEGSLGKDNVE